MLPEEKINGNRSQKRQQYSDYEHTDKKSTPACRKLRHRALYTQYALNVPFIVLQWDQGSDMRLLSPQAVSPHNGSALEAVFIYITVDPAVFVISGLTSVACGPGVVIAVFVHYVYYVRIFIVSIGIRAYHINKRNVLFLAEGMKSVVDQSVFIAVSFGIQKFLYPARVNKRCRCLRSPERRLIVFTRQGFRKLNISCKAEQDPEK